MWNICVIIIQVYKNSLPCALLSCWLDKLGEENYNTILLYCFERDLSCYYFMQSQYFVFYSAHHSYCLHSPETVELLLFFFFFLVCLFFVVGFGFTFGFAIIVLLTLNVFKCWLFVDFLVCFLFCFLLR